GVFAAGDVIGPPGLASIAMEQARVAVCHAFGIDFKKVADRFHPTYVFSIPEAAWVGLTEEEARTGGLDYETGRSSFGTNAKARISGFPDGLVKLVFQFVIHESGTIEHFIDATFAVPTRSEAYKYAAYDGLTRLSRRKPAMTR
ncbi:MAG: hypothetical protein DMD81_16875, partial [Candidatus Rokuibacteriota bacterium]